MSVSIVFASSESPVRCRLMRFCISVVEEESGCALTVSVPWFGIVGLSYPSLTAGSLRGCLFLPIPKTQTQWFSLSKGKSETSRGPCVRRREDRVRGRSTGGEISRSQFYKAS